MTADDQRLPTRAVQQRYRISNRTVDRWLAKTSLGFPRPLVINGRRYWRLSDLEHWEQSWPRPEAA
jgi:hypothetical protein